MITSEVPLERYILGYTHASDSDVRTAIDSITEARGYREPHVNRIAITWPSGDNRLGGRWKFPTLLDAETKEPIPNVVGYSVHDNTESPLGLSADIEMYADTDGQPLPDGALPTYTDDYRAWIDRGMPEGEEPAPQLRTTVRSYIVAAMNAPPLPVDPEARKQVRVVVGDWFEWVDEDLAEIVRALRQAGFTTCSEWPRRTNGKTSIAIHEAGGEPDLGRARSILAANGITIEDEHEFNGEHRFTWADPDASTQPDPYEYVYVDLGSESARVDERLAPIVQDMVAAGLNILPHDLNYPGHWSREGRLSISDPGHVEAEAARRILASHGVTVKGEYGHGDMHGFAWDAPVAPGPDRSPATAANTRALLEEFIRHVQTSDRYPAAETYDTRLAVQCLEHAMRCVDEVAAEPDGCTS